MREWLGLYVSAEETRRLLRGLMLVVGAILLSVLFAFLLVPGFRDANRPAAEAPVSVPAGESGWLDPTEYPAAHGYEIPPLDPATVLSPVPDLLVRGRDLFQQHCKSCHGAEGRGDGPAGASLRPPPRDFTQAGSWKNGTGMAAMFHTLATGVPGSAMASYDFLTKKDRMALVHHVQSLGRFPRVAEDPQALAALAAELSAPGERVPNRIPVSAAMARLVAEAPSMQAVAMGEGAPVELRRAVWDGARAARALSAETGWRADPAALAAIVTRGAPGNGFRVAVATFTAEEWRALVVALDGALPRGE
jgi:mono/diheme cytochrome c family protein